MSEAFEQSKKIEDVKTYIDRLVFLFGTKWKTNRDIDCALWVYGHLFKVPGD